MNRRAVKIKNKKPKNYHGEKLFNKFMLYLIFLLLVLVLNLLKFDSAKKIKLALNKELSRNVLTQKDFEFYWHKIKDLNLNLLAEKIGIENKNADSHNTIEIDDEIKNKMQEENKELEDIKKNFF